MPGIEFTPASIKRKLIQVLGKPESATTVEPAVNVTKPYETFIFGEDWLAIMSQAAADSDSVLKIIAGPGETVVYERAVLNIRDSKFGSISSNLDGPREKASLTLRENQWRVQVTGPNGETDLTRFHETLLPLSTALSQKQLSQQSI